MKKTVLSKYLAKFRGWSTCGNDTDTHRQTRRDCSFLNAYLTQGKNELFRSENLYIT